MPFLGLAASLILSIASSVISAGLDVSPDPFLYKISLILSLASGMTLIISFVRLNLRKIPLFLKNHRRELFVVMLLTLFAAFLRLIALGKIPYNINGDEGWTGMTALKLLPAADNLYNNPFSSFEGFGRIHLDVIAFFINIFGRTKFALRLFPAIGGILSIPAVYLLARYLIGRKPAFVSAFLLAVSHAHIHFSRTSAVGYIHANWLAPLELFLFLSGLVNRSISRFILAALVLSIHFRFYYDGKIMAGFLIVFTAVLFFVKKELFLHNRKNLLLFFSAFLVMILPALIWSYNNPDEFGARWSKEGSFQSGWLTQQIKVYGIPAPLVFTERISHIFLSAIVLPTQDFYWGRAPILHHVAAALFVIGLIGSLTTPKKLSVLLLQGWFWSAVLSIGLFAVPPAADSYRLLMVLSAMMIFAGLGWTYVNNLIIRLYSRPIPSGYWTAILLFISAVLNSHVYFNDFARNCLYMGGTLKDRGVSKIGEFLKNQSPFDKAYFLGSDHYQYGLHPSLDYLAGNVQVENILEPFISVPDKGSIIFIIIPSRINELSVVQTFAPGGTTESVSDCGRHAFTAYRSYLD